MVAVARYLGNQVPWVMLVVVAAAAAAVHLANFYLSIFAVGAHLSDHFCLMMLQRSNAGVALSGQLLLAKICRLKIVGACLKFHFLLKAILGYMIVVATAKDQVL